MKNPRSDDLISADDRFPCGHALLDGPGGKYPDLFDFSPVPHLFFDRNGLMIGVNLAGAKMFGCKRKALLKEPLTRFMEPGDQPALHEHFKTLGRRHTARACAIHIRRTDGTPLTISLESIPVRDDFGHALVVVPLSSISAMRWRQTAWLRDTDVIRRLTHAHATSTPRRQRRQK